MKQSLLEQFRQMVLSEGCGAAWSRYFADIPTNLPRSQERRWLDAQLRFAISSLSQGDTRELRLLLAGGWDDQLWLAKVRQEICPLLKGV